MFIKQQYNFDWNPAYFDAYLAHEAPQGIQGDRATFSYAFVWDNL